MAAGLTTRTRLLLTAALVLFFAVDNWHMWAKQDDFPFCSHGLFNDLYQAQVSLLLIRVHDSAGGSAIVDSGRVVPIEWYRSVGLVDNVLVQGDDPGRKQAVARLLLDHLNHEPWHAFDESFASIRPTPGATFVGLDVVTLDFDLTRYRYGQPLAPLRTTDVFSYRTPEETHAAAH
jgi:hypothetical protein